MLRWMLHLLEVPPAQFGERDRKNQKRDPLGSDPRGFQFVRNTNA